MDPNNPGGTPPATPPAGDPPATPSATPPATPPAGDNDPVKMAAELGKFKERNEKLENFAKEVNPFLETVAQDPELLAMAKDRHNKRLGIKTDANPPAVDPNAPKPPVDSDTRNAVINQQANDFEKEVGIDKLETAKKDEIRGLVGQMIKEMVDPNGNKDIKQVFQEISLQKLPWYYRQAYKLLNRDADIKSAADQARDTALQEQAGIIGGMPSSSIPTDDVMLSAAEKRVASRMNISEEKYLENKKAISQMRASA